MSVVKEEILSNLQKQIEEEKKNLASEIESFIEKTKKMDDIIEILSYCYDTAGGERSIQEISEIEFNTSALGMIKSECSSIQAEYYKDNPIVIRSDFS